MNNRNLFLTVLNAIKSKAKVMAVSVSDEDSLSGFQKASFHSVFTRWKGKGLFYKGTNPIHEGLTFMT